MQVRVKARGKQSSSTEWEAVWSIKTVTTITIPEDDDEEANSVRADGSGVAATLAGTGVVKAEANPALIVGVPTVSLLPHSSTTFPSHVFPLSAIKNLMRSKKTGSTTARLVVDQLGEEQQLILDLAFPSFEEREHFFAAVLLSSSAAASAGGSSHTSSSPGVKRERDQGTTDGGLSQQEHVKTEEGSSVLPNSSSERRMIEEEEDLEASLGELFGTALNQQERGLHHVSAAVLGGGGALQSILTTTSTGSPHPGGSSGALLTMSDQVESDVLRSEPRIAALYRRFVRPDEQQGGGGGGGGRPGASHHDGNNEEEKKTKVEEEGAAASNRQPPHPPHRRRCTRSEFWTAVVRQHFYFAHTFLDEDDEVNEASNSTANASGKGEPEADESHVSPATAAAASLAAAVNHASSTASPPRLHRDERGVAASGGGLLPTTFSEFGLGDEEKSNGNEGGGETITEASLKLQAMFRAAKPQPLLVSMIKT